MSKYLIFNNIYNDGHLNGSTENLVNVKTLFVSWLYNHKSNIIISSLLLIKSLKDLLFLHVPSVDLNIVVRKEFF